MPGEHSSRLMISLRGTVPAEENLGDLQQGFLVNSFDAQHPVQASLIPADLVFDSTAKSPVISNTVSSKLLDDFFDEIQSIEPGGKKSKAGKKPKVANSNSKADFEEMVEDAVDLMRRSDLEKVVLSRYADQEYTINDHSKKFKELIAAYPDALCSITSLGEGEIWMGASPEILIHTTDELFQTVSLAGTITSAQNQGWSSKEIEEQALVSRYIVNCFKKLRLREYHEYGPKTIKAGKLSHLKSVFSVDLTEIAFDGLADQMLELLHPTSAVCGMPLDIAREAVLRLEEYDRSLYAGFLGPVNLDDATTLFVNLRCMRLKAGIARIYAGAGITEDSIPEKEYQETEMKMETMRSLL
ncbi:MAG: chorismate-binding protein [Bacteroidota bacterium]